MRISKDCKIEKCAAKEAGRYAMHHVRLFVDKPAKRVKATTEGGEDEILPGTGKLVATDGRRLVVVPVETGEHDVTGYITSESLATLRKVKPLNKYAPAPSMDCNGSLALSDGRSFPRPTDEETGEFPRYMAVIPTDAPAVRIGLNARYLLEIAQAMGSENDYVLLEIQAPVEKRGKITHSDKPITVRGSNRGKDDSPLGVLMPITVD